MILRFGEKVELNSPQRSNHSEPVPGSNRLRLSQVHDDLQYFGGSRSVDASLSS
jgi:hypothetical protein